MPLPLVALFLAAFAVGTNEFVVAGLLPNVAGDLGVTIATAGLLISGYALGVAIGGPIVAILTTRFARKPTLLGLMTIFVAGNVLCALAPSYAWLMGARVVISLSHGAFFGIASVAAAALVPENRRAGAISLVLSGITVANIAGVPLGTAVGGAFGWRMTFVGIAALGIIAAAGLAVWLPPSAKHGEARQSLAKELRALGRQEVWLSFAMIITAATGFFASVAYIAPILIVSAGLPPDALPWVLAVFGIGAFIGNLVGGRLADWRLMPSVIVIFSGLIVIYVVLLLTLHNVVPVLFLWMASNFGFASPLQARVVIGARDAPNLASTLVSTAFNIGIAVGAAIGALALAHGAEYAQLPWIGMAGVLPALGLALVALALDRRQAVAAARVPA